MSDQRLPRNRRMTERHQFVRLFDQPIVYKSRVFQAFWKVCDEKKSRLGITIKGKLSSVWRARVKRTIREWFRKTDKFNGESIDLNIVFNISNKTMTYSLLDQLKSSLDTWG